MNASCDRLPDIVPTETSPSAPTPVRQRSIVVTALQVIVAMLILFCILESAVRVLVVAFKPAEGPTQFFDRKFHLAQHMPANDRPCIIFIGTSIGSYAVYSDLIAANLRKNGYDVDVWNLCSVFSSVSERLFLLRTAVQSGARPLLVVCDFDPLEYSKYFQQQYQPGREERFTSTVAAVAYSNQDSSLKSVIKRALMHRCYLFTFRSFLQAFLRKCPSLIVHPEQRYDGISFVSDKSGLADRDVVPECSKHGWSPCFDVADQTSLMATAKRRRFYWLEQTGRESQSWFSLNGVWPIIEFCANKHIPLAFVWHPMFPLTEAEQKEFATMRLFRFDQVGQQMCTALKEVPNTDFWDFHNADMDESHFFDVGHQNPAGAVEQSERITKMLLSPPYMKLLEKGAHGRRNAK